MSDPHETAGQHVQKEAPQELFGRERPQPFLFLGAESRPEK
jgi:hypothetical protein